MFMHTLELLVQHEMAAQAQAERRSWLITPLDAFVHPKTAAKNAAVGSRLYGAIQKRSAEPRQFYVALEGQPRDLDQFLEKIQ
jgi:hypothetical protein